MQLKKTLRSEGAQQTKQRTAQEKKEDTAKEEDQLGGTTDLRNATRFLNAFSSLGSNVIQLYTAQ